MQDNTFWLYLTLGAEHIADLAGYDHILFVAALCAIYTWKDGRAVVGLITAFTLGHSLTLALTTLNWIPLKPDLVEFLIPVTILLTCLYNILLPESDQKTSLWQRYGLALAFGLIHGMGFANFLRSLLGKEENLLWPLFAFNLGLEIGQLCIVAFVLSLAYLATELLKVRAMYWRRGISAFIAIVALQLIVQTWPF